MTPIHLQVTRLGIGRRKTICGPSILSLESVIHTPAPRRGKFGSYQAPSTFEHWDVTLRLPVYAPDPGRLLAAERVSVEGWARAYEQEAPSSDRPWFYVAIPYVEFTGVFDGGLPPALVGRSHAGASWPLPKALRSEAYSSVATWAFIQSATPPPVSRRSRPLARV